jgi:hypothetical protein
MVNLTDDQVDKIREWAAQTRYVKEVGYSVAGRRALRVLTVTLTSPSL